MALFGPTVAIGDHTLRVLNSVNSAPQFGLDKAKPGKKADMETIRAFSLHTELCSAVIGPSLSSQ